MTTVTKRTKKITTTQSVELPFYVGCDPEVLLFYGTKPLDCKVLLKQQFKMPSVNCSEESMGWAIDNVGSFGWDGASSTGEIRPNAVKSLDTMVANIETLLKMMVKDIPFVDVTTLSIGSPIGGHIHMDDIKGWGNMSTSTKSLVQKTLATFLLALTSSDHKPSVLFRLQNGGYGQLTDIRWEEKQFARTAEIRGLTAEWLSSPKLTKATFAYVFTVWREMTNNLNKLAKESVIIKDSGHASVLQDLMLKDYNFFEKSFIQEIKKLINKFEYYPTFKNEIDFILDTKAVAEEKKRVGWNVRLGWNLAKTENKKLTKSMIVNKKKTIAGKTEAPQIAEYFNVPYNNDNNVSYFANAISERVAVHNWALQNEYFLFGIKNGFDGYSAMNANNEVFVIPANQSPSDAYNTLQKMKNKAYDHHSLSYVKIDPKTGSIRQPKNKLIFIGIPFKDRQELNFKPMLELIWLIENNKIKAKNIESFPVNKNSFTIENDIEEAIESSTRNRETDFSGYINSEI